MNNAYPNLNMRGGSMARLTVLRNLVAHSNAADVKNPPSLRFADWRAARESFVSVESHDGLNAGRNADGSPIWYTHGNPQFRNERYADEVENARIDHMGWFVDDEQCDKVRGIVAGLSHGRYIAGYEDSSGCRVYVDGVYDDDRKAAYAADSIAERVADKEREYSQRWHAAEELDNSISEVGRDVARMFKLRHTSGFDSAADYRELEESIAELRRLKTRRAEYSDIQL